MMCDATRLSQRRVCRGTIYPCRPAAMRLSVRLLMRIYQELSWHLSATTASGSCCAVKDFMLIISACNGFITSVTWSMDFVMDALATGRKMKCLTCVDNFTKECLTVTVAFGVSSVQATRVPDSIALTCRSPLLE